MTARLMFPWDCGYGCPPIYLDLPVEQEDHGDHMCLAPTHRADELVKRAVTLHLRLGHGVSFHDS